MGYCYTRDAGLFALADGMGGHPEGEVASQMALQKLSALFQHEARPKLADPLKFLHAAIIAAHYDLLRYATRSRTHRHAAHHRGGLRAARQRRVLGPLRRLAAALRCAATSSSHARDHSYSELQETLLQTLPMADRVNRNVLFTCLGSPGKPVVDTAGPLIMHPGDRVMLCSDGLWGTVDAETITELLSHHPISDAVPGTGGAAPRAGGPGSDNVTVLAVDCRWATRCLRPPSTPAWLPKVRSTNSTMPRSSAPSARSTKPSSAAPAGGHGPAPGLVAVMPWHVRGRRGGAARGASSSFLIGACHDLANRRAAWPPCAPSRCSAGTRAMPKVRCW
ncbi:MAG: hypothetical protein IPN37_08830 [Betaproteobacteria bacterium]|nr:hypothetical protein [Betaproteobacteria bacterium]